MQYANNYKAVQSVITNLGSEHNLSLTRLGNSKKCVFVEGRDIKTLLQFQTIIDPTYRIPVDHIPCVSLGGWTRFNEALGAARLFHEETAGDIRTYCILDRDYHTEEEIKDLYAKAIENHLILHVWDRKEIENYLISPRAIFRMTGLDEKNWDQFQEDFMSLTSTLYGSTLASTMDYLSTIHRGKAPSSLMAKATELLSLPWITLEGRISVVNGKDLLSALNSWLRDKYKVRSSRDKIIKALTCDDISQEIKDVIQMLTE